MAGTNKTLVLHGEFSPYKKEKLLFPVQSGNDSAQPSVSDLTGEKTAKFGKATHPSASCRLRSADEQHFYSLLPKAGHRKVT